jgi:predicted metal-dependent HD superfamily phosphohydrolase
MRRALNDILIRSIMAQMTCFTLQRWSALSTSIGIQLDPEQMFRTIKRYYSEPHRAYHNARHIIPVLEGSK